MGTASLAKAYARGDVIIRRGDPGGRMYVVDEGEVEVMSEGDAIDVRLALLGPGGFFGEVPFFERKGQPGIVRATVRAHTQVRVVTLDRNTLALRLQEDPSLAYRILQTMARRIEEMEKEMARLATGG